MKIETVDIATLKTDPANVRLHNPRNLEAIKGSLARFEQQKPLVVDADGVVRAGNGTLEAARALGWTKIEIVRTGLVGSEATAYAIADNRTAELAAWDDEALAATLEALKLEDADLVGIAGFDAADLERLAGTIVSAPSEFGEVDENIETDHECPKCGYKFSGGK